MSHNKLGAWLLGGMLGLVIFQGCEDIVPTPTKKTYDLAAYLFPEASGTMVYQLFKSQKPNSEGNFTAPEYQQDIQYAIERNTSYVMEANKVNTDDNTSYSIQADQIAVMEYAEGLSYHFDRNISLADKFVREPIIRKTTTESGNTELTYECNATEHSDTMQISPSPKIYQDILKISCLRRYTRYVILEGKHFANVEETQEENYAAKGAGIIQSEKTKCEYTQVDSHQQEDYGCTRKTYKIWVFVSKE